jgi:hypothetical protein
MFVMILMMRRCLVKAKQLFNSMPRVRSRDLANQALAPEQALRNGATGHEGLGGAISSRDLDALWVVVSPS